tara:strand:- start:3497 stop:3907 length:411 start_codon:yes stop_codon:yes gene_type:complete
VERVAAIFAQERYQAAQVFPRLSRVILEKSKAAGRGGARQFAYFDYHDYVLGVAPKLNKQSDDRIRALIRHELGHGVEALYAYSTVERRIGVPILTPERYADAVAEAIWGDTIWYDADDIQTLERGVSPRPRRLGL